MKRDIEGLRESIKDTLDHFWNSGKTPRIVVDARKTGVDVPASIRNKYLDHLPIDLIASYPMDITFDADAIRASLAFNHVVTRCVFPWPSIYAVLDAKTHNGVLFGNNVPEDVEKNPYAIQLRAGALLRSEPDKIESAAVAEEAPKPDPRSRFRVIDGGKK